MSMRVVAQTNTGPVTILSGEDDQTTIAFYRHELRTLRDGGYAPEVTAIELLSDDAGDMPTPATDKRPQATKKG